VEVQRCKTGVPGLDDLIEGGIPSGRVVLVSGGCGTGKSMLGAQFLYHGALEYDEPGILVSLEQNPELFKQDMAIMGLDFDKMEEEGKIIIIDASLSGMAYEGQAEKYTLSQSSAFSPESILGLIKEGVNEIGAKRAVVDSFSALDSLIETRRRSTGSSPVSEECVRKTLLGINYKLQSMGLTSILITDNLVQDKEAASGIEDFIVDGVITLHYNVTGPDAGRNLIIRKMRSTKHSENINTIEFRKGEGLFVKGF